MQSWLVMNETRWIVAEYMPMPAGQRASLRPLAVSEGPAAGRPRRDGLRGLSYDEGRERLAVRDGERGPAAADGPGVMVINQEEVIDKELRYYSQWQIVAEGEKKVDLYHVLRNEGVMWKKGATATDMDDRVELACRSLFRSGGGISLKTYGYTLRSKRSLGPFEFRQYYLQRARLSWLASLANGGVGWAQQRVKLAAEDVAAFE